MLAQSVNPGSMSSNSNVLESVPTSTSTDEACSAPTVTNSIVLETALDVEVPTSLTGHAQNDASSQSQSQVTECTQTVHSQNVAMSQVQVHEPEHNISSGRGSRRRNARKCVYCNDFLCTRIPASQKLCSSCQLADK